MIERAFQGESGKSMGVRSCGREHSSKIRVASIDL